MLCLRRPPEQARPSGSACLSARVREAAGQVSCRAAFGVGSFTPKLCVAIVTPVRPREAIASAIIFCSKTRSRQKKNPDRKPAPWQLFPPRYFVFHPSEWSFLTVSSAGPGAVGCSFSFGALRDLERMEDEEGSLQ